VGPYAVFRGLVDLIMFVNKNRGAFEGLRRFFLAVLLIF